MNEKSIYNEEISFIRNVADYIVKSGSCRINDIQIQFNIGFRKTLFIIKILEEMEIVSPINQPEGRKVLVNLAGVDYKFKKILSESPKHKKYEENEEIYVIKKIQFPKRERIHFVENWSKIRIVDDHDE